MTFGWLIWSLLLVPVMASMACLLLRSTRQILVTVAVAGLFWMLLAFFVGGTVVSSGYMETAYGWLLLDSLSAYHIFILGLVFGASSVYAMKYFENEEEIGHLKIGEIRRFGSLWFGAATAMSVVITTNNIGIMWVGIEATTVITAFLICTHISALSLEAMWKYMVVCSVGVAFAFVGTLLVAASAQNIGLPATEIMLWASLNECSGLLNPSQIKLAFIFLLIGYGTKAGLAPMHSWLPDAHSQAPAPVSALFSGFMLNAALYCIMRYIPIVEGATNYSGWSPGLLKIFGLISILVAAVFIVFQHDGKRLLAYSSVEHMGIISLGLGLGGVGVFAALWHTLNHSICKTLAFFAVGRLGQMHGTHDLNRMAGVLRRAPVWGIGFFAGILALIGAAPFALFMSEFQIMRAAVRTHSYVVLILFLLGAAIVFLAALKYAIIPAWEKEVAEPRQFSTVMSDVIIVAVGLGLLLLLGIWLPSPLRLAIEDAAAVIGGVK